MRKYSDSNEGNVVNKTIIKLLVIISAAVFIFMSLLMIFSAIITYNNVSENLGALFMIIVTVTVSLFLSVSLTLIIKLKGVIAALISTVIILLSKIIATLLLAGNIHFDSASWINILFSIIFCFIGGLIGSNIKK